MKNNNPHTVGEAAKAGSVGYLLALAMVMGLLAWGHDTGRLASLAQDYLNWLNSTNETQIKCTTRNTRVIN